MASELIVSALVGLVAALIGAVIVAVGWLVTHRFEVERSRAAKRRELMIQYLIEAFRRLEYVSNRPMGPDMAPNFEKSIADIQLFGTAHQVELAQQVAVGMVKNGEHSLNELLFDLRKSLREELDLERVPDKLRFLRLSLPTPNVSVAEDSLRRVGKKSGLATEST